MGFLLNKSRGSETDPFEYLPATAASDYVRGEILVLTAGLLVQGGVDSTGQQDFVCGADITGAASGSLVPVIRIAADQEFEVERPAGTFVLGTKYTLGTDRASITNTSTNGVFEVTSVFTDNGVDKATGLFKQD